MNFRKITFKNIRQNFCRKPIAQWAFKPFPGAVAVLLLGNFGLVDDTVEFTQKVAPT